MGHIPAPVQMKTQEEKHNRMTNKSLAILNEWFRETGMRLEPVVEGGERGVNSVREGSGFCCLDFLVGRLRPRSVLWICYEVNVQPDRIRSRVSLLSDHESILLMEDNCPVSMHVLW